MLAERAADLIRFGKAADAADVTVVMDDQWEQRQRQRKQQREVS